MPHLFILMLLNIPDSLLLQTMSSSAHEQVSQICILSKRITESYIYKGSILQDSAIFNMEVTTI